MATDTISKRSATALGALAGLVAAVVALGVAELVAGLRREWKSPVLDVGDRIIDRVPLPLKTFAIETFGDKDKIALLAGIGVFLALYAMVIGALAFRRHLLIGIVGIGAFGVIGALAALSRRVGGSLSDAIPSIVGAIVGAAALWLIHRIASPILPAYPATLADPADASAPAGGGQAPGISAAVEAPTVHDKSAPPAEMPVDEPVEQMRATRRQVLVRTGGLIAVLALVGAGAASVGRSIKSRFSAAESRASVRLPDPSEAAVEVPAGVEIAGVDGIAPFFTSNADFYRVDTALTVPQLPTDDYELRITGMVDRELTFSFDELLRRDVVEYDITLTCVSITVGGGLIGNARWLGVRLDELLQEAGVQRGADQVVGRSIDGYTCGFPLEAAMDGRNAIVAFGMNGEPLPLEHGFPARLIVPGLYGYVSATKWLVEIELTRFDEFEQYWVPRGYDAEAPIKLMSRIDSVDGLGTLVRNADGTAAIGGVAWAQTRGISNVEVQIDDGDWMPTELGEALNDDTWRQWAYRWTPAATGRTSIAVRATDGDGVIQTDERSEPIPNGASGHHQIVVFIE